MNSLTRHDQSIFDLIRSTRESNVSKTVLLESFTKTDFLLRMQRVCNCNEAILTAESMFEFYHVLINLLYKLHYVLWL